MSFVQAVGVLTATGNFSSNDTVIVGGVTYKFEASPGAANDVDVGSDLEESLDFLARTINGTFATGEAHADSVSIPGVTATNTATTLTITLDVPGEYGNGFDFREGVDGSSKFSITTPMASGAGDLGAELDAIIDTEQLNSSVISRLALLSPASD